MENNITCTIDCNYRTAATLYIYPRNKLCFIYIIVNTPNKSNNNNNNNTGIVKEKTERTKISHKKKQLNKFGNCMLPFGPKFCL